MRERTTLPLTPIITRPNIVIRAANGRRYIADAIHHCIRGGHYCIAFKCSGQMVILKSSDVADIEYELSSRSWCTECDDLLSAWPEHESPEWVVEGQI